MRLWRRLGAVLLAGALVVGSVTASAGALLPAVNTYPGFADVAEGSWYAQGVRTCYEAGLMNGTDKGFQPEGTMTVAETATIAARLRVIVAGGAIPSPTPKSGETLPWWTAYTNYLQILDPSLAPLLEQPEEKISRQQYFMLLKLALSGKEGELLSPINTITALPDTQDSAVLEFYNAGILTGTDEEGTFDGDKTLTRAECAVMVARLADPAQRQAFALKGQSGSAGTPTPSATAPAPAATSTPTPQVTPEPTPSPAPTPTGDDPVVMTVNDLEVPRSDFVQLLNELVYSIDYNLYFQRGTRLDWDTDYGVGDLRTYLLNLATNQALRIYVQEAHASKLGCAVEELPAKLYGDPGHDALSAFAKENDYLCAKHILVADEDSANAVLDGLKAVPTLDQFNALLFIFGTDPGMQDDNNPNGYLFTAGEMVPEFEEGTRALAIGSFSKTPVQSSYGYHIIWRLDPVDHPDLLSRYQYAQYLDQLDRWTSEATVTLDQAAILAIDPKTCYETFLSQ